MLPASLLAVFAVAFSVKVLKQRLESSLGTYEKWTVTFLVGIGKKRAQIPVIFIEKRIYVWTNCWYLGTLFSAHAVFSCFVIELGLYSRIVSGMVSANWGCFFLVRDFKSWNKDRAFVRGENKNQMLRCIKIDLSMRTLLFGGSDVYVFYFRSTCCHEELSRFQGSSSMNSNVRHSFPFAAAWNSLWFHYIPAQSNWNAFITHPLPIISNCCLFHCSQPGTRCFRFSTVLCLSKFIGFDWLAKCFPCSHVPVGFVPLSLSWSHRQTL